MLQKTYSVKSKLPYAQFLAKSDKWTFISLKITWWQFGN